MADNKQLQRIPVLHAHQVALLVELRDWFPDNGDPQSPEYWREVWGADIAASEAAAKSYGGTK